MDLYDNYSNYANKYACVQKDGKCSNLIKFKSVRSTNFSYAKMIVASHGVVYDENRGKYILDDDLIKGFSDSINFSGHKYTCFSELSECSKVYFVVNTESDRVLAVSMDDGSSINDVLETGMRKNEVDSTMKLGIEKWFEHNLLDFDDYLEDTIFCNGRDIKDLRGWDPDGGFWGNVFLSFDNNNANLKCNNKNDSFSTLNEEAKLQYKIGAATYSEMSLLNNKTIRKINSNYYLFSPFNLENSSNERYYYVSYAGVLSSGLSGSTKIRPVVSLRPYSKYEEGDGSKENPYIVNGYDIYHKISVSIKDETKDLEINIDDMSQVEYEEEVTFKVTPIKGYKVNSIRILDEEESEIEYSETGNKNEYTFVMPSSNVTIVPSYERVKSSVEVEENTHTKVIVIEVEDAKAVVYEDTVKFTITPEEGYEVDTIEIKDKEGNKIEYKKTNKENEYEFVMPDSDVVIIPTYRKIESINVPDTLKNPNTGTGISIIIIVMLIISSITYIIFKRKKNYIMK